MIRRQWVVGGELILNQLLIRKQDCLQIAVAELEEGRIVPPELFQGLVF